MESDTTENFFQACFESSTQTSITARNADVVTSEPHPYAWQACNQNSGSTHCSANATREWQLLGHCCPNGSSWSHYESFKQRLQLLCYQPYGAWSLVCARKSDLTRLAKVTSIMSAHSHNSVDPWVFVAMPLQYAITPGGSERLYDHIIPLNPEGGMIW